jgi:hypothetical protein
MFQALETGQFGHVKTTLFTVLHQTPGGKHAGIHPTEQQVVSNRVEYCATTAISL